MLARTGTTVTCKGGYRAAGIGGSWAIRNIGDSMFNMDMYGHGVNMHFGSQSNPDYWGGTINATGGEYGAGIGAGSWGHSGHSRNTIHGGAGERLYFYSGTVNASGGSLAAGIGGGFRGRGSHIYIYGGNIDAQGRGYRRGHRRRQLDDETGHGRNQRGERYRHLRRTGKRPRPIQLRGYRRRPVCPRPEHHHHRRPCVGDRTLRRGDRRRPLVPRKEHHHHRRDSESVDQLPQQRLDAAAVGYGDIVYKPEELVADPSIATNDQIRIGSYKGKLVKLKLEARALSRDDEYSYFWNLYETLIPDENGLIDMQLLTLPYVQNYGWAINVLEMTVIDDPATEITTSAG